jgi:hypothetical protein
MTIQDKGWTLLAGNEVIEHLAVVSDIVWNPAHTIGPIFECFILNLEVNLLKGVLASVPL